MEKTKLRVTIYIIYEGISLLNILFLRSFNNSCSLFISLLTLDKPKVFILFSFLSISCG